MGPDESCPALRTHLWDVVEDVLRAPTKREIESRVCDGVQAEGRFDCVWICSTPPDARPRAAAGRDLEAVERAHRAVEREDGDRPWARAANENVEAATTLQDGVWGGNYTLGCVPLHHRRINYGVLVVASESRDVDEVRRDLEPLHEFGQIVGHALATGEMQTHGEIFRQAIEQAEPAFAILDDEGDVEYANIGFESVLGYSKSDAIGSELAALVEGIPPDVLGGVGTGDPWSDEVVSYRPNGRETHLDVSVAAVPVEGGTRSKYVVAATDITPIRQREQRIQVLNRVLRHNLRNDLDAIRGYVEQAANTAGEPTSDVLESAMRTIRKLLSTAETSRKVQSTLSETEMREQDLVVVLQQVLDRIHEEYPDHELDVSMPETVRVTASNGLEDALWELLENACVHGRDPVEVNVETGDETVLVEIIDRGPGIPDHELAVLETGAETPLEHGSGLGLWLAHWVIEASHGRLEFEEDGATTVRVSLTPVHG